MKGLTKRGGKERATAGRPYGRGKSGGDKKDCLARHRGRCRICKHPEREEIEREFLDWVSPREIAETWKIASYRAIYRHAHAVGLFRRRRENWQAALDRIIERVGEVKVTAAAVVAAIRLSAMLECASAKATAHRRDLANGSADAALREGQKFAFSLEGLPRTDAVRGHEGRGGKGTLQRALTVGGKGAVRNSREELRGDDEPDRKGHRLKAVPQKSGRPSGSPLPTAIALRGSASAKATAAKPAFAKETEDGDSASSRSNEETPGEKEGAWAGRQKAASRGVPAPLGAPPAPGDPPSPKATVDEDPRVVFAEDGRVAGMAWPWPKGKITFAQGWRWRRRRGGTET